MRNIKRLTEMEGLAARKASLYGRTLTDVALANVMRDLAEFHGERVCSLGDLTVGCGEEGSLDDLAGGCGEDGSLDDLAGGCGGDGNET